MFYFFSKSLKIFIEPNFYFFIFAFLMLFFVWKKRHRKLLHFSVLMFILYFFTVTSPLPVYLMGTWLESSEVSYINSEKNLPHLQAAVVLSGDGIQKNLLSGQYIYHDAFRRFAEGLKLLQKGKVDFLIISKGNNQFIRDGMLNEGDSFLSWIKDLNILKDNQIKAKII